MNSVVVDFEKTNGQLPAESFNDKSLLTLSTIVKLGKLLSKQTPNTFDDEVLEFMEQVMANKEFVEVLVMAMKLFKKEPNKLNLLMKEALND